MLQNGKIHFLSRDIMYDHQANRGSLVNQEAPRLLGKADAMV